MVQVEIIMKGISLSQQALNVCESRLGSWVSSALLLDRSSTNH